MNIITLLDAAKIFVQFAQMKISSKLAYKIMKFQKSVEVEEDFYNKRRVEIINTYAEKDDAGNPIVNDDRTVKIIADKTQEAYRVMQELNNTEVDVPNVKFTLAELEGLELSVAEMYVLDAFIEE
jgi:hypothetical protein